MKKLHTKIFYDLLNIIDCTKETIIKMFTITGLNDSATWIANKDSVDLKEVYYNYDDLKNIYSLHLVSDNEDAQKFIDFVYSKKGQEIIKDYGKDEFGMAVYNLE